MSSLGAEEIRRDSGYWKLGAESAEQIRLPDRTPGPQEERLAVPLQFSWEDQRTPSSQDPLSLIFKRFFIFFFNCLSTLIVLNLSIISGLGTYFRYGIIFYACEVSSKHLHTFRVTYPSLWISNNESHVDKAVDGMVYDPSAGDTHFHQLKDESGCKKAKKNCRITSIRSHPRLHFAFLSFFPLWKQLDMAVWMEGTECSRGTGFSSIGLPWSGCHVWQKVKVAGNPWRCLSFCNSEAVLSYLGEILVS